MLRCMYLQWSRLYSEKIHEHDAIRMGFGELPCTATNSLRGRMGIEPTGPGKDRTIAPRSGIIRMSSGAVWHGVETSAVKVLFINSGLVWNGCWQKGIFPRRRRPWILTIMLVASTPRQALEYRRRIHGATTDEEFSQISGGPKCLTRTQGSFSSGMYLYMTVFLLSSGNGKFRGMNFHTHWAMRGQRLKIQAVRVPSSTLWLSCLLANLSAIPNSSQIPNFKLNRKKIGFLEIT